MTTFKHKTALLAAAISFGALAAPASAQTVAVADLQAAMEGTKAFQTAAGTIRTTYATQISQVQARQTAIQTELQPLVTKFQADQRANVAPATLQGEVNTIQTRQNAAQQELATMSAPISRAQSYVLEQIQAKLPDAVNNAMKARSVSLLLKPDAAFQALPASDLTSTIVTQLDALVPSVNAIPPANWQPGQQQAAAAAPTAPAVAPAAAGARPTTPARPAATGR